MNRIERLHAQVVRDLREAQENPIQLYHAAASRTHELGNQLAQLESQLEQQPGTKRSAKIGKLHGEAAVAHVDARRYAEQVYNQYLANNQENSDAGQKWKRRADHHKLMVKFHDAGSDDHNQNVQAPNPPQQ